MKEMSWRKMMADRSCGTKSLGSGAVDERSEPRRGGTVRRAADAIKWKIEDGTQSPARSPQLRSSGLIRFNNGRSVLRDWQALATKASEKLVVWRKGPD